MSTETVTISDTHCIKWYKWIEFDPTNAPFFRSLFGTKCSCTARSHVVIAAAAVVVAGAFSTWHGCQLLFGRRRQATGHGGFQLRLG